MRRLPRKRHKTTNGTTGCSQHGRFYEHLIDTGTAAWALAGRFDL